MHTLLHAPGDNGTAHVHYAGGWEYFTEVYSVSSSDGYLKIEQYRNKPHHKFVFIPEAVLTRIDL